MNNPVNKTIDNTQIGVVIIGRNEGLRLKRCINSVMRTNVSAVYVDSGSTDDSVSNARAAGVHVVELDLSTPFCAARARNEGYRHLLNIDNDVKLVQFIDGDCEIIGDWMRVAQNHFEAQPKVAILCGWLHERSPETSIYNRIGNLEWNFAAAGDVDSVGGIFMVRREVFDSINGFDPTIPAGEEPELCQRVREKGWRIQRIDCEMAWHDLAMTRFSQWWKRMIRFGYGSLDVSIRFGLARFRRNNVRAQTWSIWLIAVLSLCFYATTTRQAAPVAISAILLSLWPIQLTRIAVRTWRKGHPVRLAFAYGFFIMLSFWPQMLGQIIYRIDKSRKRNFRLLEYKSAPSKSMDTPQNN